MPNFRAINQPSESPLKPTVGEPSLPDAASRQKCQMDQGQASARHLVSVRVTDKQSRRHPKRERDPRRDVTEGEGASRKPKKKKRKSKSSPSMPRRQQADREKKLVQSIEYSPPKSDADGVHDSDYRPSTTDMADSILSSTSNTPSRRSPREHSSRYPNAGSSAALVSTSDSSSLTAASQDGGTPAIIKRGCWPNPRGPSPSSLNSELRRDKYKVAECVELPKAVFESEQSKKKKTEVTIAGKRKEKGKIPMYESTRESDKRKAEDQVEQNEPQKRSKSQKSPKPSLGDCSFTYDGQNQVVGVKAGHRADSTNVHSHAGTEAKSHSFEGTKKQKVQHCLEAGADAQDSRLHGEMFGQSGTQASGHRGQQKRHLNEGYGEPCQRRDVLLPESQQRCSCSKLPPYFTSNPNRVPCLATWLGGKVDFFKHLKQIRSCGGSVHPAHVVDACTWILESNDYSKRWDNDHLRVVSRSAPGGSSTHGRNDSNFWRPQSSISPPDFYGNEGSSRPSADVGTASRSVPDVERSPPASRNAHSTSKPVQPQRPSINGYSPYKSQPRLDGGGTGTTHTGAPAGQPADPVVVHSSSSYLTPPNSSPLGQRCRVNNILSHHACNDSPSGQESVRVKQVSKVLPKASSGLDRPQMSFDNQRQRHQSVPANLFSRKITADERNPLHPSEPQRHDNPLQEISNNTTVLRTLARKLESMEKILERIPATPPTQVAPVQPAPAPAPAPAAAAAVTVAASNGNRAAQHPPRTRRKKPSRAERQRKLPRLNRNVPAHLRLPDEDIIAIGRRINHYERHSRAPYAFSWDGTLFADYKRLLVKTVNGRPVWTADEINRLRR